MKELAKTVMETKNLLVKSDSNEKKKQPRVHEASIKDGIRIRRIVESEDRDPRKRQEYDMIKEKEVLDHIGVEKEISGLIRIVKTQDKNRTIILKVPNQWKKRTILATAARLKNYHPPVFVSEQLTKGEAKMDNNALMR